MAETRKFDYEQMKAIHDKMQDINERISDTFTKLNNDMDELCQVEREAIYGDLGEQLQLDWDNTSSDFPNFLQNFDNWGQVVASVSGNFATFEQEVQGLKELHNGLGLTAREGATEAYVNTGALSQYTVAHIEEYTNAVAAANTTSLHNIDLSNIQYASSDITDKLKWEKFLGCAMIGGNVVSLFLIGTAVYAVASGAGATTAVAPIEPTPAPAPTAPAGPAITGPVVGETPLLEGTVAQDLGAFSENVILTQYPAGTTEQAFMQALNAANTEAANAGATFVQQAANGANILEYIDSSGNIIGFLNQYGKFVLFK